MGPEGFYSLDSLVGIHVLIVDDEPACRELFTEILRYCGALVTTTASVVEALRVMQITKCDVVLADIAMPGEDGFDLIRKIRALKPEDGGVVRAVAVTAWTRGEDRDAIRTAGFDAYLTKPVDPWALCRLVASLAMGNHS
jgi:CheY-like chemotaxis protein